MSSYGTPSSLSLPGATLPWKSKGEPNLHQVKGMAIGKNGS